MEKREMTEKLKRKFLQLAKDSELKFDACSCRVCCINLIIPNTVKIPAEKEVWREILKIIHESKKTKFVITTTSCNYSRPGLAAHLFVQVAYRLKPGIKKRLIFVENTKPVASVHVGKEKLVVYLEKSSFLW